MEKATKAQDVQKQPVIRTSTQLGRANDLLQKLKVLHNRYSKLDYRGQKSKEHDEEKVSEVLAKMHLWEWAIANYHHMTLLNETIVTY